ncbi:putative NRPS-like protein biosynthetic cluster [Microsporum audouinii]
MGLMSLHIKEQHQVQECDTCPRAESSRLQSPSVTNMALLNTLTSCSTGLKLLPDLYSSTASACHSTLEPSLPEREFGGIYLQDILKSVAASRKGSVICYPIGNTSKYKEFSYLELYTQASHYGQILRAFPSFKEGHPILLHFDDHWDTIVWFWAVLLANGLPVLSPPFSVVEDHRLQHIRGLSNLLQFPICITRNNLLNLFDGTQNLLQLHTIESLYHNGPPSGHNGPTHGPGSSADHPNYKEGKPLAMLMLTSGSTGNAKAVCLSHKQVVAAISGKASVRQLHQDGPFMNWIGLDHVASLVEIHIQALWLGVDQVHVNAVDIVSSPDVFLDLLSRHRVYRTFAPNFFLGRLVSTMKQEYNHQREGNSWDLSNLHVVASGGEANDVTTCVAASAILQKYGARPDAITPGFGMTETCAGAIFNLACPSYDVECGYAVASLGKCMKGIEMRVVVDSRLAAMNEPGDLEVRGDVVFGGYYRNPEATADAFPLRDGWFRTGDQGRIDANGNLCLIGRKKDIININGIKIVIADVGSLLERAISDKVDRFVVFPSRAEHTEQVTICYTPREWPHTAEEMVEIGELAARVCISSAFAPPLIFSLRESSLSLLPVSSLGKISSSKMSSLFETGVFSEDIALHRQKLDEYRKESQQRTLLTVATEAEALLIDDFANTLGINIDTIGPETQFFELGFTSLDLIRLKRRLDTRLGITLPIITLMNNTTARSLAAALNSGWPGDSPDEPEKNMVDYEPVVTLKSGGKKPPLWLFHPGVGEVLVFIGLAQHLADDERPIYALRARGFERGQSQFTSITEAVNTYTQAIRQRQQQGPYALAGYSYGAMLAFETAKQLNYTETGTSGSSVRFLGSFNLPPHIKWRMRQLHWNMCLLHLTQFLGLTTEEDVEKMEQNSKFSEASRSDALEQIIHNADHHRMEELDLENAELARWADVAYGLQSMAVEYEPSGQVDSIDVFHAIPLKRAAPSREKWITEHLIKWRDFSQTEPRLHAVGGAHYTMIGPENVAGFVAQLKDALAARGV